MSVSPVVTGKMIERRIFRMKRQRNKCLESACVVLQCAQLQQMIDAVFIVLYVPIEHRRI